MPDPHVLVERCDGNYDRIVLSRPRRRNALTPGMVLALTEALRADGGDRPVVVRSASPAAFCAGADLSLSLPEQARTSDLLYLCYEQMITRPGPVIAVIDGPAVGGGAQLAAAADIRVAGPRARLRWAGPPGRGLTVGAWIVPALVGRSAGMEIVLCGSWVDAAEALALGLLNRVDAEPALVADRMARELAVRDRLALARTKLVTAAGLLERLHAERVANRAAFAAIIGADGAGTEGEHLDAGGERLGGST